MPKVTIWIRVEDIEKWESIPNKPEWLHAAINQPWQFDAFGNLKVVGTDLHLFSDEETKEIVDELSKGTDLHPATSARITKPEPVVEPVDE